MNDNSKTLENLQVTIDELAVMINKGFIELRQDVRQDIKNLDIRLSGRIDALESKMNEKFDQIDARFDGIDERFIRVDKRFDEIDEKFKAIDSRFDTVDSRFDDVQDQINGIKTSFTPQVEHKALRDRLKKVESKVGIFKIA